MDLRFALWEAIALLALFALQFPFPVLRVRLGFAAMYAALAIFLIARRRRHLVPTGRAALFGRTTGDGS